MSATSQPRGTNGSDPLGRGQSHDAEVLSLDQAFEILQNRRRREVLKYLDGRNETVSLSDLAEHVAAVENDTSVQALSSSQRKRVYVGLYQCHLPKMDDLDIVDFDQNRGRIERAGNFDQLDPYLEPATDEPYWYYYYASMSALGIALLVLSQSGAVRVGLTPSVVLVALIVAVLTIATLHYCKANGYLERI